MATDNTPVDFTANIKLADYMRLNLQPLPQKTTFANFVIPNKLYGRDCEIRLLTESFDRISSGHGEVMLVRGYSGTGKTALVHELQTSVLKKNGFFITGKFNQYQQDIPYFSFRQALTELCRELQHGYERDLSRFKIDILQAVGNHGQLLIDLVPEFEAILGTQPALAAVSPQEARHRFTDVLRNFLRTICRPEHPMVLFIDDWQWADPASFELLKKIHVGTSVRYFLVIASYRDNEVDSSHPLSSTIDDLRIASVPVVALEVTNITAHDVREMVADTLKPQVEDVERLAEIIHDKTLGNPFFVRSFFSFLHESSIILFDVTQQCWRLNEATTQWDDLPDDIVALFELKLRRLDSDARHLFSLAACLGSRFDLETLSIVSGFDMERCLSLLFSTEAKDFFQLLDGNESSAASDPARTNRICAFQHDRLQQAAYILIEPAERPNILLKIGRVLLSSLKPDQLAERLFEVVNNLNAGYDLIQATPEMVEVVKLNISAARKAYAATAYSSALQFYRAAASFLEKPGFEEYLWRTCHELTMALFKELAGCEFLAGDRNEAEKCIQQSVNHSGTALEKADAFCILIVQYTLLARYPEAIAAGRHALESLQITLPEDDYEIDRDKEIALVRQDLKSRSVSSLAELPIMSNPEMLMASKILITMAPTCYRSHQRLWSVIVPKVVNLTLQYGNIPQIGYSHTAFGGLLGWVDDDYVTAREFGELATRLMADTFRNPTDQSVFYLMIGSSLRHWYKHLMYGTQDYRDAYEMGLRSGNLQYAAYAFGHDMYCQFYQGVPLSHLIQETLRSLEFSRTRLNQWAIDLLEGGVNVFRQLSCETPKLNGSESWSEDEYLGRVKEHHNIQVTCIYRIIKTFSLLVTGNYDDALALSDATEPLIYTVGTQGLLPWPEHVFARFLILSALYSDADGECQTTWRSELARLISKLRIWADNCPENFEHKYLLAAAELARIDGRPIEAMRLYDEAVEEAHKGNFPQWEGMANERAYNFCMESGNGRLAQVYWQQAYVCYDRWGAVAKVRSMETSYRTYLADCLSAYDGACSSPQRGDVGRGEIEDKLVERQINQLRNVTFQMEQAGLRSEAVTLSRELADAMQRLRVEIADHKRTEEALRESEDRYKKLFVEAPLGIALIDSLTGHIYEVNPMFAKIAGRTEEEIAQIDWMRITHPDDIQEGLDNMARMNAGKTDGFQMEKRYLHPDGAAVWINMTIAKVKIEDKAHPRHLSMVEDITGRKRVEEEKLALEQQLHQAQKMESLGVLAGGIAHDFNNILAVIICNCYLGIQRPKLAEELFPEIETAAQRAAALCRQMLAYAGKTQFVESHVDMTALLDDTIGMLKSTLPQNVNIKTYLTGDIPPIQGDASQLRQIVTNMMINASEAIGEEQGDIRVALTKTKITAAERLEKDHLGKAITPGSYLCLEVTDTGCGMDDETQKRIFEPFFTTKFVGRGLGMSALLGVVTSHKGALQLTSKVGKGTTVKIYLPVQGGDTTGEPTRQKDSEPWRGSGTILLVEDEPQLLEVAKTLLEMLGFSIIEASNGVEAIEQYRKNAAEITLVLTDIGMPLMNGYQLIQELKKINPKLPIIVSSGFGDAIVTTKIAPGEIAGLISKPYSFDQLREVLDKITPTGGGI